MILPPRFRRPLNSRHLLAAGLSDSGALGYEPCVDRVYWAMTGNARNRSTRPTPIRYSTFVGSRRTAFACHQLRPFEFLDTTGKQLES